MHALNLNNNDCFSAGVKVSKLPQLKSFMEYESKQVEHSFYSGAFILLSSYIHASYIHACICMQKKKIARTSLESMQAIGVQKWFQQFPQLKEYSSRFAELTPDQMLKLKDGDLLETFNIENNVDRQYTPTTLKVIHAYISLLTGICCCNLHVSRNMSK